MRRRACSTESELGGEKSYLGGAGWIEIDG
uniref:Uncharacterized protein n=1 Tax=Arundo donax TaxID=35708 RepID=A0A0A9EHP9_ARUDO